MLSHRNSLKERHHQKGAHCFLELETIALMLSTGWLQELIRANFHNRTRMALWKIDFNFEKAPSL